MSYSENLAKVVANQVARFVTLNRHQLAGHVANLEFWVGQVRHALAVIDGYQERFRRLKGGQAVYVAKHQTTVSSPLDPEINGPPELPHRIPDAGLRDARRALVDSTYAFLLRLCNDGLIPESQFRSECGNLNIGIDPADIRRGHG